MEDNFIHYAKCENQPEGFPCVCDEISALKLSITDSSDPIDPIINLW